MGGIKRINVAVVVNNMPVVDKAGKVTYRPLTAAEKTQINDLAMQAMGFNKDRGDSLTVVNTSFAGEPVEPLPEMPVWENQRLIEYGKDILRFIVGIIVLFMIYSRVLKPLMRKLIAMSTPAPGRGGNEDAVVNLSGQANSEGGVSQAKPLAGYDQNIEAAKQLAKDNPRMVASIVANWTNGNE
jgi:flagellar M-ring protein FliF